jgi:hypothetical protein
VSHLNLGNITQTGLPVHSNIDEDNKVESYLGSKVISQLNIPGSISFHVDSKACFMCTELRCQQVIFDKSICALSTISTTNFH